MNTLISINSIMSVYNNNNHGSYQPVTDITNEATKLVMWNLVNGKYDIIPVMFVDGKVSTEPSPMFNQLSVINSILTVIASCEHPSDFYLNIENYILPLLEPELRNKFDKMNVEEKQEWILYNIELAKVLVIQK